MSHPDSSPDLSPDDAASSVFGEGFVKVGEDEEGGGDIGSRAGRRRMKVIVTIAFLFVMSLAFVGHIVFFGPSGGGGEGGVGGSTTGGQPASSPSVTMLSGGADGERGEPVLPGSAEAFYREPQYRAAMMHFNSGDIRRALSLVNQLEEEYADIADIAYTKGIIFYMAGNKDLAYKHAMTALERDGKHSPSMALYGLVLHEEGRGVEAIPILELAVKIDDTLQDSWYCLGSSYRQAGRVADAERALKKLLTLSPDHSKGGWELAQLYDGLGRSDDAVNVLLKMVKSKEGLGDAHMYLSKLYCRHGRVDAGLDQALVAVRLRPNDAEVQNWLSEVYALKSQWKKAADAVEKAVELSKRQSGFLLRYGDFLSRAEEYRESTVVMKEILKRDPGHYDALTITGHNLTKQKLHSQSRLYLEQAIKAHPGRVDAWELLVPVYVALDQPDQAANARETVARLKSQVPQ